MATPARFFLLAGRAHAVARGLPPLTLDTDASIIMKLEIFTLCDSASDYHGKLCMLGAFDRVMGKAAPMIVPHCAVACRLRFHQVEEGEHKLRLIFADEDGKPVLKPVEASVSVKFGETSKSAAMNFVMNVNGLKLDKFGEYTVDLAVDGVHLGSQPLYFDPPAKEEGA
jgi:hypothetical protein